jgi:hypothetical protein
MHPPNKLLYLRWDIASHLLLKKSIFTMLFLLLCIKRFVFVQIWQLFKQPTNLALDLHKKHSVPVMRCSSLHEQHPMLPVLIS